jgi:hypothetical protein
MPCVPEYSTLAHRLFTKYCSGDQIEKNEMGGACTMYGGEGEVYTEFWWGNLGERDHLWDPGIDGIIILIWIFRKWDGGDWIELAQDKDRWQASINVVMNLRVPYNVGNFLTI